jgi:hypothetical protein
MFEMVTVMSVPLVTKGKETLPMLLHANLTPWNRGETH